MRSIAKFLRYIAKWCDAISYCWRTRKLTRCDFGPNGETQITPYGFWRRLRLVTREFKLKDA